MSQMPERSGFPSGVPDIEVSQNLGGGEVRNEVIDKVSFDGEGAKLDIQNGV